MEISGVSEDPEADAEPSEADKIKMVNAKIIIRDKIKIHINKNLTKRVPGMLMGLPIQAAPAIGPRDAGRPIVPTPSTVAGPTSLPLVLNKIIRIEKLAALE